MSLNGISDFLYYYCFFPSAYASCWDQEWSQVPEFYHDLVLSVCCVGGGACRLEVVILFLVFLLLVFTSMLESDYSLVGKNIN